MFDEVEMAREETLSLASLNALEYCERRFFYEHVFGYRSEQPLPSWRGMSAETSGDWLNDSGDSPLLIQRIWVRSTRFHLDGFADVVNDETGHLIPVEYQRGSEEGWLKEHLRLCALALCLEEEVSYSIPYGYVLYLATKEREKVLFSETLRQCSEEAVWQALRVLERGNLPAPLLARWEQNALLPSLHPRCRACRLESVCLPREVWMLSQQK